MTLSMQDTGTPIVARKWPLGKPAIVALVFLFPFSAGIIMWLLWRQSHPEASRFAIVATRNMIVVHLVLAVVMIWGVFEIAERGDGSVRVFAPTDEAIAVEIDGKKGKVDAGRSARYSLGHGDHTVTLTGKAGPREFKLTVPDGLYDRVLPYTGQCFVVVDVTTYLSGRKPHNVDELPKSITDIRKIDGSAGPVDPPTWRTTFEDLDTISDRKTPRTLLRQVPCDVLAKSSEDIVRAAFVSELAAR